MRITSVRRSYRARRGGSWIVDARNARAACRDASDPSNRSVLLGLRLMRRCS